MAVTPNYGWPVPVATDYVKDGWEAISDLGNAIDTTVAGLKSGLKQIVPTSIAKGASGTATVSAGGLITFTGTESISANGCFTSTYANYKLVVNIDGAANAGVLGIRFRAAGTDNTTSNYTSTDTETQTINTTVSVQNNKTVSYIRVGYSAATDKNSGVYEIITPQESRVTQFIGDFVRFETSPNVYQERITGTLNLTTSFDGFTIYGTGASQTVSGTIRIYGYQNG